MMRALAWCVRAWFRIRCMRWSRRRRVITAEDYIRISSAPQSGALDSTCARPKPGQ